MEITTHNRIEFKIVEDENVYSFTIPHGCKLDKAIEVSSAFVSGLIKLQKEHEEKNEEDVDDTVKSH